MDPSPLKYNDAGVLTHENFISDWTKFVEVYGNAKAAEFLEKSNATDLPDVVSIDLASDCNLKCPMCRYHGSDDARAHYAGRHAEIDDVVSFFEKAGGVETIAFGVMSEPFMRKDIWDCLEKLQPLCKSFEFSTNALPLTKTSIQKLARFNVKIIHVSCDAGDAEGYAKWRAGGKFSQFQEKLKYLADEFGDRVVFHAALYEQNQESLLKAPAFLKEIGLGELEMVRLFETTVSKMNGLKRLEGPGLISYLVKMLETCDREGIKLTYGLHTLSPEDAEAAYRATGGRLGCQSYHEAMSIHPCSMPWDYLGFQFGGNVKFCCGGVDGFPTKESPFKMNPLALVNSPVVRMVRAMTLAGFTPTGCSLNCGKKYRPTI